MKIKEKLDDDKKALEERLANDPDFARDYYKAQAEMQAYKYKPPKPFKYKGTRTVTTSKYGGTSIDYQTYPTLNPWG